MPKKNESKILERLANDHTLEMMPDELEKILDAELDKPADEIDTILVREILKTMETAEPDPERKRADWEIVKKHLPHRRAKRRWTSMLMRFAATAAVIAVVMGVTFRDAEAFRWTLITKLLMPVAQTFGIVIDDQNGVTPEATPEHVYTVSDAPSSLVTYATLDEVPQMYEGYIIRPRWIPEGFVFSVGTRFTSVDSEIFSIDFVREEAVFNLHIHIATSDSAVYSREFERNLDVPIEMTVGQHQVTFYRNTEDEYQSAFWIHENAHYLLVGEITVDDVIRFVEHME